MEEKQVTFSVQMTAKEIFRFSMYHVYHGMAGRIGVLLAMAAWIYLFAAFDSVTDQTKTILTIVGLWYTVLEPITIMSRAKSQKKRNKAYSQPLDYRLDAEGINVSQGEVNQSMPWKNVQKIVETRTQYLLYTSRVYACIFPKSALGEQCPLLEDVVLKYAKDLPVKWKGSIRKKVKKK